MSFDAGSGGGGIDPSNLHLKKELTQIRKAARVLRDPGTSSSSWRSTPLNSGRSLTRHHYVHHHKMGPPIIGGNEIITPSSDRSSSNNKVIASVVNKNNDDNASVVEREKEKRVFLHNWRSQRPEIGDVSKHILQEDGDDDAKNNNVNDAEGSILSTSSKSDAYLSERYNNNSSDVFKRRDADLTSSIMRTVKKKPERMSSYHNSIESIPKQKKRMILTSSLVDQSDDATMDFLNFEVLTSRASAISPLLARFNKIKGRAHLSKKEDDSISYSTSSHHNNKYGVQNPSTVESWDSLNDADDEVDDEHLEQQGCGIPCYWSKRSTPKSRIGYGSGSCCSPSIPDSHRRKGSSIFGGTKSTHQRRRSGPKKRKSSTRIPLLTSEDDELAVNFGELDLEALSRLDGKRWSSSCRSQDGMELVVVRDHDDGEEGSPENARSLGHKYRPLFFEELVGQNIVVQSLKNLISRKRVGPVYLFHGPCGTGKTSAARIFAAALNCLASEENNNNKPCGVCRECVDFISGHSANIIEVDGSNKTGIEKIKNLLKNLSVGRGSKFSQFKVFVVDECHLLPSKMWLDFLRLVEKPLPNVVFVLVTTEMDNLPRSVLSRCQKHLFSKIGNSDIVARLRKIGENEDLDVDPDALEMIAMNVDGSLRDAETMLDQLSLFGKRIGVSLVNELIGVVSDEKLLELLELAMSSNATETVIRARELMDSGVDPIVLMSQMATLIVDIIAGVYPGGDGNHNSFFGGRNLSERELDRLKHALNLLSEAEKHLRLSSERSTWFTATLLQLGSGVLSDRAHSGSSSRQSSKATEDDRLSLKLYAHRNSMGKDNSSNNNGVPTNGSNPSGTQFSGPSVVLKDDSKNGRSILRCVNSKTLANIWVQCVEKCHSKTLRELLHAHGRIMSISEVKGGFVAHIGFTDPNIKARAEGFLSSITNSFEIVLRHNVEVKIIRVPEFFRTDKNDTENNSSEGLRQINPSEPEARNANASVAKGAKSGIPVRRIESIIHEQRLETAWLQAVDNRGTPQSAGRMKPERNQVLPQDGPNEYGLSDPMEDELNRNIKDLILNDRMVDNRGTPWSAGRMKPERNFPISPSLLHNSSFASNLSRDNTGYESSQGAAGCGGMFCWNNSRRERSRKAKQGTPRRGHKNGRISCFGGCAKAKRGNKRYSR